MLLAGYEEQVARAASARTVEEVLGNSSTSASSSSSTNMSRTDTDEWDVEFDAVLHAQAESKRL